jgi:hypothetical protein
LAKNTFRFSKQDSMSSIFYKTLLICCLSLISKQLFAQHNKIDTIPFTLDKRLLVFSGKINNETIDFAFDTGAQSGVANTKNVEKADITVLKQGTKISDANNKAKRINDTKVSTLSIGNHVFKDLKDHTIDMPFLYCADLYLLGQNVIKKLNWKIDFEKMEIYVSKNPFESEKTQIKWEITNYRGNRPHVNYSLGSKTFKNLLVDTGFTGVFELDSMQTEFLEIYNQKAKTGKTFEFITSSMGLMGLGKPSLTRYLRLDKLSINQTQFQDFPVVINPSAEPKIGIGFFYNYCTTATFNFSNNAILLEMRQQKLPESPVLEGRISLENEKFAVTAISASKNSTSKTLRINEEILSVNNKKVSDFKDECEFLLWMYLYKDPELIIERQDNTKTIIRRLNWE